MKQRGPYQKRIDKIARKISPRHPDLSGAFIEECIRAAWIDDISDGCYLREAEHMIMTRVQMSELAEPTANL